AHVRLCHQPYAQYGTISVYCLADVRIHLCNPDPARPFEYASATLTQEESAALTPRQPPLPAMNMRPAPCTKRPAFLQTASPVSPVPPVRSWPACPRTIRGTHHRTGASQFTMGLQIILHT